MKLLLMFSEVSTNIFLTTLSYFIALIYAYIKIKLIMIKKWTVNIIIKLAV